MTALVVLAAIVTVTTLADAIARDRHKRHRRNLPNPYDPDDWQDDDWDTDITVDHLEAMWNNNWDTLHTDEDTP